ncbi:hypothetical protein BJ165DRAFT_1400562 [Panaeolus papilionaceus]|nr:hypothetical protein BJ165DRAFT_1400562 [Panaeolus papilionaceus]
MSNVGQTTVSSSATSNLTAATSTGIVVMVEGTRFWLSINEMSKFSNVFRGMFFNLPNIGSAQEGTTSNPIVLHNIKRRDFAPLALWIRYGADYTEGDLLGMLHLADQWDMVEAEKFCFDGIWKLLGNPFFMLRLATSYRRWNMVGELIALAVKVPLLDWKFEESSVYEPIMKLRIRLDEVQRRYAAVPDSMPQHEECRNHVSCTLRWRNDWRMHVMEQVFHPDHPLPLKQCQSVLAENSINPNACRRLALTELRIRMAGLDIEDDLYKETENEIKSAFH